jgi:hypothetical protein
MVASAKSKADGPDAKGDLAEGDPNLPQLSDVSDPAPARARAARADAAKKADDESVDLTVPGTDRRKSVTKAVWEAEKQTLSQQGWEKVGDRTEE